MKADRQTFLWLGVVAVCMTATTLFFWPASPGNRDAQGPKKAPQTQPESVRAIPAPTQSVQKIAPIASPSPSAIPKTASVQQAPAALRIAEIGEAVTRYNKTGISLIAPHLEDADPEVRAAACEGLVQLGESDAIPLLENLAARTTDPEEAIRLKKAAEFLKLPPVDVRALMKAMRAKREASSKAQTGTTPAEKRTR